MEGKPLGVAIVASSGKGLGNKLNRPDGEELGLGSILGIKLGKSLATMLGLGVGVSIGV
jgi:hypothetical protein